MAGETTTTLASVITEVFQPGADVLWRNNAMLSLFGPPVDQAGDVPRWVVHYAGQTATEFSEGAAAPAAGSQSYADAVLAWRYFAVTVRVTGHARDRLRASNAAPGFGAALPEAMSRGQRDLVHGISTSLMDNSAGGLDNAVDSTGTYAGLARGTYAWWASYEQSIGTLAESDLETMFAALEDQPRITQAMGPVDLILATRAVVTTLKGLGHTNAGHTMIRTDMGNSLNLGFPTSGTMVQGVPVVVVPNLTSGTLMALRRNMIRVLRIRDFEVKQLGPTGDYDEFMISAGYALQCENPYCCGKLTDI